MDYDKHYYILKAIEALRKANSWTGKTHLQKTMAIADCIEQGMGFKFVLYKHGPYSFEVDEELEQMLSYDALTMVSKAPYGPSLRPGSGDRFPKKNHSAAVKDSTVDLLEKIAHFVGTKGVMELESLATSIWIRQREGIKNDIDVEARLRDLKPHLSSELVGEGIRDSKKLIHQLAA